jgi:phosphotransferase system enzyme I (PtsI)
MAASARAFLLLFGMGLRSYSMRPAFIPTIKELASHITEEQTRSNLNRALRMKTARQVIRLTDQLLKDLAPDLAVLETA